MFKSMQEPNPSTQLIAWTVLLVEDDPLQRIVTAEMLRSMSLLVLEAGNSAEAILLVEAGNVFDLMVTDIMMPGKMDGLALAAWIKERFSNLPVLAVSANLPVATAAVDAWLTKPYEPEMLWREVERLLAREQSSGSKL